MLAALSLVSVAVGRAVVQEVRARRSARTKAEAGRVVGDAGDDVGLAGFVERQLEIVTIEQVDTVEGQILSGGRRSA